MIDPIGKALGRPHQEINAVGFVVARDELLAVTVFGALPGSLEQQVHGRPGYPEMSVVGAMLVAAAGIVQVRQVELIGTLPVHEIEHGG